MNNRWLQFLIPKVKFKVENLADVALLNAKKVKIYGVKRVEDGYIITVRRGMIHDVPVVGRQSIYSALTRFVLPACFVWAMLLIAIQFITIDYEIQGNLVREEMEMVTELVEPHFIKVGNFAFFRGNQDDLIDSVATAFHDYIWIDVQIIGSRMVINIFDTKVAEATATDEEIDTIYAKASGVVTDIEATGCRVLVEIDQIVKIGDALITCYTPTGFGTDVAPIDGIASGSVYAHVWYEVEIEFPREYGVRMVTGSSYSNLFLNFGSTKLRIWGSKAPFEEFDERNRVFNPLAIFNIAPITLERVHYYEKDDIILTNEVEMIRKRADDLVKAQLSELMASDFELVDLQFLTIDESDENVKMVYHATVREDIAARD